MKIFICILAHHKPWLLWSTLMSLVAQDRQQFHLHIIYIRGDGQCVDRPEYARYHAVSTAEGEINPQLSQDNPAVLKVLEGLDIPFTISERENDHGLDSGAWYEFIGTRIWEEYDYVLCLMEGALFTSPTCLSSLRSFVESRNVDWLAVGHEKRTIPKSAILGTGKPKFASPGFDKFYRDSLSGIVDRFCEDPGFSELFERWDDDPLFRRYRNGMTQYHVPTKIFSIMDKLRLFRWNHKAGIPIMSAQTTAEKKVLVAYDNNKVFMKMSDLAIEYDNIGEEIFHREASPGFFGCSCQHLFSIRFLKKFEEIISKYDLYQASRLPFAGQILEPIWGLLPNRFGVGKWFWSGIHRPRKNFLSLRREDTMTGYRKYLNIYFGDALIVDGDEHELRLSPQGNMYDLVQRRLGSDRLRLDS